MKISYLACMYDTNTYKRIFQLTSKPMQAAGKYHMLTCEGLIKNQVDLDTIAILPINRSNYPYNYIRGFLSQSNGVKYGYIPIINIKFLKQIFLFWECFKRTIQSDADVLIFDYLNIYASKGSLLAARFKRLKTLCIITDLPEFVFRKKIFVKKSYQTLKKTDTFILLTSQMAERAEIKGKPYIVLEGHVNYQMKKRSKERNCKKKIILYAGTLEHKYGIVALCQAFVNVAKEDEELHIYGDGSCKNEVLQYSEYNNKIKFFGNVPNEEVVQAELRATLLVNPRSAAGEFTKYSFPSKTMEYMATGTPVLMYCLPGIPREYYNYLFFIDDGDPTEKIGNAIRNILDNFSELELMHFGQKAKNFVIDEKNNIIQSRKIIEFINTIK